MPNRWILIIFIAGFSRGLRGVLERPLHLILSFFQPLLWTFFLYVAVLSRFGGESDGAVGDYLIPGIGLMSFVFVSSQTAISVIRDLQFGVLDRVRTNSLAPQAVFLGKMAFDVVRSGVQSLVVMLIAYGLMPIEYINFWDIVVITGIYIPFGIFYVSLSGLIAIWAKRQEYVSVFVNLFNLPLIFTSTIVMPDRGLNGWLGYLAEINLLSVFVSAGRSLVSSNELVINWLVIVFLFLVTIVLNLFIRNKLENL